MFFFVKQKTAYEMRISDWSSDVCSSDLYYVAALSLEIGMAHLFLCHAICQNIKFINDLKYGLSFTADARRRIVKTCRGKRGFGRALALITEVRFLNWQISFPGVRSEEHTSELQSLMRISYAVFCLKKKMQE